MTSPCAIPPRTSVGRARVLPGIAAGIAAVLAKLPPKYLCATMEFVRGAARPAPAVVVADAREAVLAASLRCAVDGCLRLSIATALLCRFRGVWPTWRVGVRSTPFSAHAWVEADGRAIGESFPDGYYHPILTVAPRGFA
ncbi:lasso peptide biosynthesis B2 protein [Nocardia terpenica]|uniref:Microcin J25-processing protein McjB C-terminal domain-containing protein n=1 Tax=Nocardia terpenica TaxID=455432 RepID=A0A291RNW4_9NOCA|nr:lasso peptide biosynthesis B2 protein [Nocardia terpenica]ATL68802.1 hypothetical protein CRH09_24035 [Nocardia terpenica]